MVTVYMQYRVGRFGTWTDFDLAANAVALRSILFSYSSPSRAEWYVTAPEHTMPIAPLAWVRIWDDVGTDDQGNALTSSNPLFLGIVTQIRPGEHSNQVLYTAMDPTYMAAKTVTVMSLPYQNQTTAVPVPATGAVPRLVYNAKNTGDEDYSYEVAQNSTTANLVSGLLDFTNQPLYWLDCAPGSGTTGTTPYSASDLTDMTYVPQEKIVWESTTIRAALEQVWRCEPRYRFFWHPGSKLWRFYKLNDPGVTPNVTLYLNDTGLVRQYPVVGCDITPSFEDCVGAVSIYGPPSIASPAASFYWDDTLVSFNNTNLQPVGSAINLQSYSDNTGGHTARTWAQWQIHDPTQRAGSRTLADWTNVPISQYQSGGTREPVLLASWDRGTTWTACGGVWFDFLNGTATFEASNVPYQVITDNGQPATYGSTQTIFPPNAFKLIWGAYQAPLKVRYPSSGFSGTANGSFGMQTELVLYDESLAIGREYGVPVTSSARQAQYTSLAQFMQQTRCDINYTGGAVLAGCDYQYCRLNKQVNIADAAGATTGWESMYAPVTDVEYVYGPEPSTNLTFNGHWLELYGQDTAELRTRLRINSFSQYTYSQVFGNPITTLQFGGTVENYNGSTSRAVVGINISNPFVYVDQYGHREMANIR